MFSVHEPTWSRELKQHLCCGSTHSYHKHSCVVRNTRIPGRSSDENFVRIQALKSHGLTSGEVAAELKLPLEQVNDLWSL